jgi:tetratricopeptide (TPR) repeat protein
VKRPVLTALLLSLAFLGLAAAQGIRNGNLKVRVTFTDGRPCNMRVLVRLMLSAGSNTVLEGYTNDEGLAEFDDIEVGNYHLVVSGQDIETTDTGLFEVDNRHGTQFQTVTVKRKDEGKSSDSPASTVAVQDMNIPKAAVKQFDKASALIAKQEWKKAIDQLSRALAIYPTYVQAYNNLGVVYARIGDRTSERTALQKALSINDHFAPAWVNLARMAIVDRDFPKAESLLDKATAFAPNDSETLMILANVELMNLHYDRAIAHCQETHSLGQDSHSLVHFIAARAYEHESKFSEAIKELKTFLKEEASGVRADAARRELATLQSRLQINAQ